MGKEKDCFEKEENASKRPRGWKSSMGEAGASGIDICLACFEEDTENEDTFIFESDEDNLIDIGDFSDDDSCCEVILSSIDDEDNLYYFDADDEPDNEAVNESSDDGITERIIDRYHV